MEKLIFLLLIMIGSECKGLSVGPAYEVVPAQSLSPVSDATESSWTPPEDENNAVTDDVDLPGKKEDSTNYEDIDHFIELLDKEITSEEKNLLANDTESLEETLEPDDLFKFSDQNDTKEETNEWNESYENTSESGNSSESSDDSDYTYEGTSESDSTNEDTDESTWNTSDSSDDSDYTYEGTDESYDTDEDTDESTWGTSDSSDDSDYTYEGTDESYDTDEDTDESTWGTSDSSDDSDYTYEGTDESYDTDEDTDESTWGTSDSSDDSDYTYENTDESSDTDEDTDESGYSYEETDESEDTYEDTDESYDTDEDTDESGEDYLMNLDPQELIVKMYRRVEKLDKNIVKLSKAVKANNKEILRIAHDEREISVSRRKCPTNFVYLNEGCYYFHEDELKDWEEAQQVCQSLDPGSNLASMESRAEWTSIKDYLTDHNLDKINWWLGGSDLQFEGQFRWVGSKERIRFSDWCRHEPNNYEGKEDCVLIVGVTERFNNENRLCWNDFSCRQCPYLLLPIHFICETNSV